VAGSAAADASEQQRRGVDGVRLRRRFMPYPQPYALGPALLEAQLWLLGKLLAVVNSSSQMQVLEVRGVLVCCALCWPSLQVVGFMCKEGWRCTEGILEACTLA
jgi:hypothetical protein